MTNKSSMQPYDQVELPASGSRRLILLGLREFHNSGSRRLLSLTLSWTRQWWELHYWGRLWQLRGATKQMIFSKAEVEACLKDTNLFFILGNGRSGTQMLSELLNKADRALVLHEPNFAEDVAAMPASQRDPDFALHYIRDFRRYEFYHRIRHHQVNTYGEVTGTLRFQVEALKRVLPHANLLHLVRNGRDVVRSILPRKFYREGAKGAYALGPLPDDPYFDDWPGMTRFEKICWLWQDTHRLLLAHIPLINIIQLEKLTADFTYFNEKIAGSLALPITFTQWQSSVTVKSNATTYRFSPHWTDWSDHERDSFERICGEMMAKLGYD